MMAGMAEETGWDDGRVDDRDDGSSDGWDDGIVLDDDKGDGKGNDRDDGNNDCNGGAVISA